ncbi:MAG: hypothetical protein KKB51_19765 [Candidatus Riflebacteria bacterium]|nr:hypothetical protein [Candidatus Riflebacteria bacterium]
MEKTTYTLFALWLLNIAVFYQTIAADFVHFDEHLTILQNSQVLAPLNFESLINIFSFSESLNNIYTPISIASHWLEYNLFGFNSALSHFINLLLHIMCATVVFFLTKTLVDNRLSAFLIASFWAVHPLQVETVAWVLERRNLLYGLFFFASLLGYAQYLQTKKKPGLYLASVFMLLSGLTKPLAFKLPFLWLLLDWAQQRPAEKAIFKEKIPGFILSVLMILSLFSAASQGISLEQKNSLNWRRASYAISFYVAKTVLPVDLTSTYEENSSTKELFDNGPLYLVIFLSFAVIISWRRRVVATGMIFFLANILLLSGLIRVGYQFYAVCHFMHIALFGLILAIGVWLWEILHKRISKDLLIFGSCVLLIFMSITSFLHCRVWQNTISLFEHSIAIHPECIFARYHLAGAYVREKRLDEAELHYSELIKRYPEYYPGYNGRGVIFSKRGEYDKALDMFNKAAERGKDEFEVFQNRGMLNFTLNNFQAAEEDLSTSLLIDPTNLATHLCRSRLRSHRGQYSMAIADIMCIIDKQPDNHAANIKLFELLLESAEYYSAASVFFSMTASASHTANCRESYLHQIFYPTPGEFFRRIGPFRSLIKYRFGYYPF